MIGLISCHEVYNYGSQLMSLALQLMVEELGIECEHIDYRAKRDFHYMTSIPFKLVNGSLRKHRKELSLKRSSIASDPKRIELMDIRKRNFDKFIHENLRLSKPIVGYSALKKFSRSYQGVILGSDQVWHPMNLEGGFKNMLFVPDNIPKIAYGASFGVESIPFYQRLRTKKYLNRIPYISVREKQGSVLIKKLVNRDIPVVLDPTLMIDIEKWKQHFSFKSVLDEDFIFVYLLGDNVSHRKKVVELKCKTGLKVVAIDSYSFLESEYIDVRADEVSPSDFIGLISRAKYVCTDSFHGTVFSILNKKNFSTFLRYNEQSKSSANSRVESLLESLGLNERICRDSDDINIIFNSIDYASVDERLNQLRKFSRKFLIDSLEGSGINCLK